MLESLVHSLRPPGPIGTVMVAAGALGLVLGVLAGVLNRRKAGFFVGVAALLAATTAAGLGAIDVVVERSHVDAGLTGAPTETARLKLRRTGYERARASARAGLALGVVPLFGGLAGVLAPLARRRRPRPQSMRMPRSLRSQARHEMGSKTGVSSLWESALATLAFVVCAIAWTIPLPAPALDPNDPAWDAREAIDIMRAGRLREGCDLLERTCDKVCDPARVPDLHGAVSECLELRLGEAEADETPARRERLESLSRTSLPLTVEERQRLREELGALRSSP